jgi:hypothetical protein
MSNYQPRIKQSAESGFYALVVRVDRDGKEQVDYHYKPRHFRTLAAAKKSTARHIAKIGGAA